MDAKKEKINSLFGNKRAAFGPSVTMLDWTAFMVLITVIILSAILFSYHSDQTKNKINELSVSQEEEYLILNLLRTQISVDGVNSDIAELISRWYFDDSYKESVRGNISRELDRFYNAQMDWELIINYGEKEVDTFGLISSITKKQIMKMKYVGEVETQLPLNYNPNNLMISVNFKIYYGLVQKGTWCVKYSAHACSTDDEICECARVGTRLLWTNCKTCYKGCEPMTNTCKGENVVEEGARCYLLWRERCTRDGRLCKCDGFNWENCQLCANGCDEIQNKCQ